MKKQLVERLTALCTLLLVLIAFFIARSTNDFGVRVLAYVILWMLFWEERQLIYRRIYLLWLWKWRQVKPSLASLKYRIGIGRKSMRSKRPTITLQPAITLQPIINLTVEVHKDVDPKTVVDALKDATREAEIRNIKVHTGSGESVGHYARARY